MINWLMDRNMNYCFSVKSMTNHFSWSHSMSNNYYKSMKYHRTYQVIEIQQKSVVLVVFFAFAGVYKLETESSEAFKVLLWKILLLYS